jgi:hypothetical protein
MPVAVLLCAQCGSHHVDIRGWRSRSVALVGCSDCNHESVIAGFTLGRVWRDDEADLVVSAIQDAALPVGVR